MRTNAKSLAMRDPAMAAVMGAIPGSDFGAERADFGQDFDHDGYGDFGADAPMAASTDKPSPQALLQLWQQKKQEDHASRQRESMLYPNRGARVKVERYTFSVNDHIVLGTAGAINMSGSPAVTIRPQRVTINAPTCGFARISEIKVANVSATLGGEEDAYNYNANGVGQALDMPTVSPSTQASILGTYSGYLPPGFVTATAYTMCGTFKGPASLAG